eukprot:317551-Chlamydomonas_euryale.AAC.1
MHHMRLAVNLRSPSVISVVGVRRPANRQAKMWGTVCPAVGECARLCASAPIPVASAPIRSKQRQAVRQCAHPPAR